MRRHARRWAVLCFGLCLFATAAAGTELKQKTIEAFNHYVNATEKRMAGEIHDPAKFLWIDQLPEPRRSMLYAQLRNGEIVVQQLATRENGQRIPIPDGLVHHWIALAFVPGVTLKEVVDFQQDYAHHQDIYKPDIERSTVLSHEGNNYKIFVRMYRKAIVTAVYNADFEIRYCPVDATHEYSRSYSTRIAEVEEAGQPTEHEKPVGNDRGFLWRLYTYWNYEQKDGGVYMQIEFVALSRTVPFLLGWLVNPYLRSIPRDYLTHLLQATRMALTEEKQPGQ
jgi:hypothetical protein